MTKEIMVTRRRISELEESIDWENRKIEKLEQMSAPKQQSLVLAI